MTAPAGVLRRDLGVLKLLASGRTLVGTAEQAGLLPNEVRDIARRHYATRTDGTIDPAMCGHAAAELEGRLNSAPPRRPATAPATRPVAPRPNPSPATTSPGSPSPGRSSVRDDMPAATTAATSTGDVLQDVKLGDLHPDPHNPRENIGDVTELAASLLSVGMLQPIVARRGADGKLILVAGHRRLAAARLAGWTTAPVVIRRDMRPDDVLAAMLVENSHRKDLDPIEEARGYARLKERLGTTEAGVGRKVGRTASHVGARMMLLTLPIEEQEALRLGAMTLTEATERAKVASGRRLGTTGPRGTPHLSATHELAQNAKARCLRLKHSRGKGQGVGGIACGACWESVIRADERRHLHSHSARTGTCALCDTPLPMREATG